MGRLVMALARARVRRTRGDAGVAAVLFALTSVVIFGLAAMCVDLGHQYVMHEQVQRDSDFAALAGGADLPAPTATGTCGYGTRASATDQPVVDVAKHLLTSFNTDGDGPTTLTAAQLATQLVDCDLSNGEVVYGTLSGSGASARLTYDRNQLTVITPQRKVPYNIAPAIGLSHSGDVRATSTVKIGSPLIRSLPLYTYTTCDYGPQTIAQPTNGKSANIVMLSHPTDSNVATFNAATANPPPIVTNPATTPATVPENVQAPNDSLVINGSNFSGVTQIGFFESGDGTAGPEPVTVSTVNNPDANLTSTSISLAHIPPAVTSVRDTWYIRLYAPNKSGTMQWSAGVTQDNNHTLIAAPLQVGSPTLMCGQGSNAGNFGTLQLTNQSSGAPSGVAENIAYNIATNVQQSVALFPSPQSPYTCTSSTPGASLWPSSVINCVGTKTGLDLNAATEGFITGPKGTTVKGRLAQAGTSPACSANGNAVVGGVSINNDTLSCFFTNSTTNVGDITSSSYAGPAVLSPAIYNSPRFALVPVLGVQPGNGSSNNYEIVDMRPAFITDQIASATKSTPPTAANGVQWSGNSISSLQVVFFNANALPPPPADSGYTAYAGYGVKELRLVN